MTQDATRALAAALTEQDWEGWPEVNLLAHFLVGRLAAAGYRITNEPPLTAERLAAALKVHWYADRPLVEQGGANLDDVLAEDARIILAALTSEVTSE